MTTTQAERPEIQCPSCRGNKGGIGFVSRVDGCGGPEWIDCTLCAGSGTITAARGDAYKRGQRIHDARVAKDLSLREFATRLELRPHQASDIENGRSIDAELRRAEEMLGLRSRGDEECLY